MAVQTGSYQNRNQVVPPLSPSRYPYPLGFGFTPSRFSPNSDVRNLPFWAETGALSSSTSLWSIGLCVFRSFG
jgi:hypothetical protein